MTTILLTAAVKPNVSGPVALTDTQERLAQYKRASAEWILLSKRMGWNISIVETTGHAETLQRAVTSPVNVIPFTPTLAQRARGKGAVEGAAMDHAVHTLAPNLLPRESLYKCTGRLTVRNAEHLLRSLPPASVVARGTLDLSFIDTRFFGATIDVWQDHFADAWKDVEDLNGYYLEHAVSARILIGLGTRGLSLQRFPARPQFEGQSGSTGSRYGSYRRIIAQITAAPVEALLRRFAPTKQF